MRPSSGVAARGSGAPSGSSSRAAVSQVGDLLTIVFAAGILVGVAAFKDDWKTQATEAKNFLGGECAAGVRLIDRVALSYPARDSHACRVG
jgi:hypothetical protein